MSYALLNLWVKDSHCNVLKNAWRMDLVIQSCNGSYLADFDEKLLTNLQARYPNHNFTILPNYMGHTRIKIIPPAGEHIYHLEMDLITGQWKIWARMCHGANEETNRVLVNARCGEEVCINLLLNEPDLCSKNNVFPIGIAALQKNMDNMLVEDYVRVMKKVAVVQKADLLAWANDRINELNDTTAQPPTHLIPVNEQLRDIIQNMPDDPLC